MEPSTPPRSSRPRGIPATPATPRFGSFGDLPDQPRKPQANSGNNNGPTNIQAAGPGPSVTPHRRKRSLNILATPRRTPKKRREAESGRGDRDFVQPDDDSVVAERSIFGKLSAPESTINSTAFTQEDSKNTQPHPHQELPPPDVPGIWYVFRGKKIFRPLPEGEKPIEPVTLFKDQLKPNRRVKVDDVFQDESGSEADTDVEW